jgi:hypothetical protein
MEDGDAAAGAPKAPRPTQEEPAAAPEPAAATQDECLERLHILPFAGADISLRGRSRIEFIAPELRRRRGAGEVVRKGDVIKHEGCEFVVVKCQPDEGLLHPDTDYFVDGEPVVSFAKIQFTAWGPDEEMTSERLFSELIVKYLKGEYAPYGSPGSERVRLFYCNQMFQIGSTCFQVEATEPAGLGVVSSQTEIFANWDRTPEFEKVHIVPFQDTLPRAYDYDVFQDYLRPYLKRNGWKKFSNGELFTWQGVQFKVVACDPVDSTARVGKRTTIYCEGVLHPSMRNLLPPELLSQVSQLPPDLQMMLVQTERTTRELEDVLHQRRGLFEETLASIERLTWPPSEPTSQSSCMICLGDFQAGEEYRRLPCRHVFHSSCVEEWLRRCTDCPICKDNVDRALRHY